MWEIYTWSNKTKQLRKPKTENTCNQENKKADHAHAAQVSLRWLQKTSLKFEDLSTSSSNLDQQPIRSESTSSPTAMIYTRTNL